MASSAARLAQAVGVVALLASSPARAEPSPPLPHDYPHAPEAFDDGRGDDALLPPIFLQLGCRNRSREFWGIAQIGLLDTRSVDFNGVLQLSLDHNANRTTIGAAQVALANYSYEFYGLMQVGAHNIIGREIYAVAQIGGFNDANGVFLGLLQLGVANRWRFHRRNWAIAPLQVGIYNERAAPSYTLGQVGIVNFLGEGTIHAPWRIGVFNGGDDTVAALLQAGVVNWMPEGRGFFGLEVGLLNRSREFHGPAQIGLVNYSEAVHGAQIGVYNHAGVLRGIQIGLLNRSEDGGLPWSPVMNLGW
ncbi:MAG: hypothetical protein DRI90_22075 [Deltaproteobacteria bacterium]|nr:MAG: hypothetical protein DRI90_22075 [Deltaproteobacteria bacterium]